MTFGARLLMAANSVVAGVLIARLMGADSLGIYLVLSVAIQILIQISGLTLNVANTHFTGREPEKAIPIAVNSIAFALASGVGCATVFWFLSDLLIPNVPPYLTIVGLVAVPFQLVATYMHNSLLAQSQVRTFNLLDILNQSFVLINVIIVLVILGGGLWVLVSLNSIAGAASAALALAVFYRFARQRFPATRWNSDFALIPPMLAFAFKGFVFWGCTILVYRVDLIIVNYFRGSAEAAVYAVATQYTLFLLLLPHAVSHLLQVRVSAMQDENGEFTSRVTRHISLLLFTTCLASVPGAFIIAAIYGNGFEALPIQIWILLPGVFFVGVQSVVAQYFIGTSNHALLSYVWLATFVVSIVLNLAVVPQFGATGAAVVSTVCYTAVSIVVFAFFMTKTRLGFTSILVPNKPELLQLPRLLQRQST